MNLFIISMQATIIERGQDLFVSNAAYSSMNL